MITQFDKNSAHMAVAFYRSARREKRLRNTLTAFFIVLAAAFAVLCVLLCRSV